MKLSRKDKFFHVPKWKKRKNDSSSVNLNLNISKKSALDIKENGSAGNSRNTSAYDIRNMDDNDGRYTLSQYFLRKMWEFSQLFKNKNIRFGLKVAVIISLFSLLAFFDSTKQWYHSWNGKWAVITVNLNFFFFYTYIIYIQI